MSLKKKKNRGCETRKPKKGNHKRDFKEQFFPPTSTEQIRRYVENKKYCYQKTSFHLFYFMCTGDLPKCLYVPVHA